MILYRMLALDFNANPQQYRSWLVSGIPDLDAQVYYGYKSGNNALVDISAYATDDVSVITAFDLPLPANWNPSPPELISDFPILKVLPAAVEDSQLAIIDGYIYMFGTNISASIYMANVNNPADWIDTGATLPTTLYGSSLAIVGDHIYLFGGNNGSGPVNTIFSAPLSNPLSWTNTGSHLPQKLQYSSLGMYNGSLYLFGGLGVNAAKRIIFTASTSNPLLWTNTGSHISTPVYGSVIAQINDNWFLYGGQLASGELTNNIWSAPVNSPTSWSLVGNLPYKTAFGKFITAGNDGYLIGPMAGSFATGFTSILQCHLNNPYDFFDTGQFVRGVISHSQIAMVYDRIWLYGGSGLSAIFACNQQLKYNFTDLIVEAYQNATRIVFPATDNLNNPFEALCVPYWITDYSMSPPPIPPTPPPPLSPPRPNF